MAGIQFNKKEIMKEAHRLYAFNRCFSWSFSKCLTMAWRNAKNRKVAETIFTINKVKNDQRRNNRRTELSRYVASHCGIQSYYRNGIYSGD